MDGTTFDFLQVDAVLGKGLEGGDKGARLVCKTQGERDLHRGWMRSFVYPANRQFRHQISQCRRESESPIRFARSVFSIHRDKKNEAREIFGIVVNVFGEDDAAIDGGSAASGDSREGLVASSDDFAHAACRVFCGNAL